jgi:Yip1 domain
MSAMIPEGASAAPVAEKNNSLTNLFGLYLEPGETFQRLRHRPNWLLPLAASLLLLGVSNFIVIERVGVVNILKTALKSNPQADQILQMAEQSSFTRMMMHTAPIVSVLFGTLATAAVLLLLLALSGEEANFQRVFCVVSYSFFAYAVVTAALAVLMVLVTSDGSKFDVRNPLASNPGFFLDPDNTNKFVYSLVSSLDVLSLWYLFLLTTGLSIVCPNLKSRKAAVLVFCVWFLYAVGKAVIAIFSS